jgi:leucyl/phenylalanyl-tRNA--protein transferase
VIYLPALDEDELWFPPVTAALDDGLLAMGGDLSVARLLLAYRTGIFPWFNEDDPILWWSPDPRCIVFPDRLKVSKSMKQLLKRKAFDFRINTAFREVISNCSGIERKEGNGTWITTDIIEAYVTMYEQGYGYSAEVWQAGELVGGLYGILLGNVFFGESMFSKVSNASKYAFICWTQYLQAQGIRLIDCQLYTAHLESLGAEMIPRADYINLLDEYIPDA